MSSRSKRTRLAAFVTSLAITSCSALGLDEYEIIQCGPDATDGSPECDPLNAELPVDSCGRYYCSPTGRGCIFEERRNDETCDGLDNDCDLKIDEGAPAPDDDRALDTAPLEDLIQVSLAASRDGTLHALLTRAPEDEPYTLSHLAITEQIGTERMEPSMSCLGGAGTPLQDCLIEDLAVAATTKNLVGAGFHRSSCDAGQLRIGIGSISALDFELGEDASDPLASTGIDVVLEQGCTVFAGCDGGSFPAVAVLSAQSGAPSEALVLWRARSAADEAACAQSNAFVIAAVRLPIENAAASARFRSASDASSQLLSAHAATGAPQVIAVGEGDGDGFLAAFPSGDRIELAFVARLASDSSTGLDPITSHVAARASGDVALTAGGSTGWAVAYRAEIDGKRSIQLRAIVLRDRRHLEAAGGAVTLPTTGEIVAGPVLSYAREGLRASVDGDLGGGWLVAWVERGREEGPSHGRLMLGRVSEADQSVLGKPVTLARGDLSLPFLYSKRGDRERDEVQCAFLESEALHVRRASCVKN